MTAPQTSTVGRELKRASVVVAVLSCLWPTTSPAKTLEELLVEKGVITKVEAAGTSEGTAKVYWNQGTQVDVPDKGFTSSVATLLQTRYAFTDNNGTEDAPNTSSFDVNRARLIISGTALNRAFSYMLSTDFVSAPDSDANFGQAPSVRDAYLEWRPCSDESGLRMGAFKTAISRQFNTDQQSMQFADRSRVSEYFTIGRENGAKVFGDLAEGVIEASAAVFNGDSPGEGPNAAGVDTQMTGIASVRVNPSGRMNVAEEGDVDWTEEVATSIGAVYAYADQFANEDAGANGADANLVNVDANVKYLGWALHAEYFNQAIVGDGGDPSGMYVQSGYYVIPKRIEFAARYGYTDCDNGAGQGMCTGMDAVNEASAYLSYHFWRHNLKAQLGYDFVKMDALQGTNSRSNRYLFQVSSFF